VALSKIIELLFRTKGVGRTVRDTRNVDKRLQGLGKSALLVAKAYVGIATARKAMQLAKTAATAKVVERSFRQLAQQPDEMLKAMKKATAGTISEMTLMQKFNSAALLGLPLERFDEMLEIARGSSQATGESMEFMLNSIVTGLGRGSKLMLDNLGIMIDIKKANETYAKTLQKSASNLTDVEKKQAFVNEALRIGKENLEKAGGVVESDIDSFQRLTAETDNLQRELGEALIPVLINVTIHATNMANQLKRLFKGPSTKELEKNILTLKQKLFDMANDPTFLQKIQIKLGIDKLFYDQLEELEDLLAVLQEQAVAAGGPIISTYIGGKQELTDLEVLIPMIDTFTNSLGKALVYGQDLGDAVVNSLKRIAAELVANAALFALLSFIPGGQTLMADKGIATFGKFLLRGFTGQTPTVNNNINISGGIVDDSYIRNSFLPAMRRVQSYG
jgi:hypothetical protein